ncbi:MAG: hypothetical protein Q9174_000069 [Haloplaca sp. 1 TL-2023]
MLSFTHRKSSSSSQNQVEDLTETPAERASRRITSKADPSKAINEAQPIVQALEQPITLQNLRSVQHKDRHGNLITDPDRSNPTRPRLERPLDTIRAFEAAIDGSYDRRPPSRADLTDGFNGQSKRSSYYQGQRPPQRYGAETPSGYYNNRLSTGRPESYMDGYAGNATQSGYGRRTSQRVHSDPMLYGANSQNLYPAHGYHQSYDTVASASGNESHNTDPWGNSTDPSSENSSIDRVQQAPKPEAVEAYGLNGFGGAPHLQDTILEDHATGNDAYRPMAGFSQPRIPGNGFPVQRRDALPPTPPPHVPPKEFTTRAPIKLGNPPVPGETVSNGTSEKRKSWLKRRFSRS